MTFLFLQLHSFMQSWLSLLCTQQLLLIAILGGVRFICGYVEGIAFVIIFFFTSKITRVCEGLFVFHRFLSGRSSAHHVTKCFYKRRTSRSLTGAKQAGLTELEPGVSFLSSVLVTYEQTEALAANLRFSSSVLCYAMLVLCCSSPDNHGMLLSSSWHASCSPDRCHCH